MTTAADVLLGQSASGDPGDPLAALLQEAEAREPRFKLVRAVLERRRQASEHVAVGMPSVGRTPVVDPHDTSALVQQVSEALAELALLRERAQELAAALGACPDCWGQDGRCRMCRGQGRPGAVMPDLERFRALVAPAVARIARSPESEPLAPTRSTAAPTGEPSGTSRATPE